MEYNHSNAAVHWHSIECVINKQLRVIQTSVYGIYCKYTENQQYAIDGNLYIFQKSNIMD